MKRILIVAVLFLAAFTASAQNIPSDGTLKGLIDDEKVLVSDLLGEDVVIVSFWASWCPPCRSEMSAMASAVDSWKGKVRFVTISIDDSRTLAKARTMATKYKWPFELYRDPGNRIATALGVESIPYAMIVKGGKTVYTHSGFSTGGEKALINKAISFLDK